MPSKPYSLWDRVTLARIAREEGRSLAREAKLGRMYRWPRRFSPFSCAPFRSHRVRWSTLVSWAAVIGFAVLIVRAFTSSSHDPVYMFLFILSFAACAWWSWHYENPLVLPTRRRRVRVYEHARRFLGTSGLTPRALAADYTDRCIPWTRARWGDSPPWDAPSGTAGRFIALDRTALLASTCGMLTMFSGQFLSQVARTWPMPLPMIFIPIAVGYTGLWYSRRRFKVACKRLASSLETRSCPDCAYPLADIPPGIDPSLLGGVNVGPARCHECGTPWPLVPPYLDIWSAAPAPRV